MKERCYKIIIPILIILVLILTGCQCQTMPSPQEYEELISEYDEGYLEDGEYLEEYPQSYDNDIDEEDPLEPDDLYVTEPTHDVLVGDLIEFGDYRWRVLDVDGDYALIITENVLIIHNEGRFNYRLMNVTWESSSLRHYLNDEFLNSFSPVDRAQIRETYVVNEDNPWLGGSGGNNTTDSIFILSIAEAVEYFGDSGQLHDRPEGMRWISDVYDSERVAVNLEGDPMWWWLRSSGQYQRLATGVDVTGLIFLFGTGVGNTGGGVRPVLWLNLVSPWEQDNFTDIREPLALVGDTDHGELATQYIRFMNDNLYERVPFSYREKEAAIWLVEELLALGHPWENIHVQEFPLIGDFRWWNLNNQARWQTDFELRQTQLSQNIILTVPGQSQRKIIVGAHYDSYPNPGASDNASGASLLLESIQRMTEIEHYYTIVYVFFGAHEAGGFLGADFLIQELTYEQAENIVLMINADMLFDGPYMVYGAAYDDNLQPGANEITRQIDAIAEELDLGLINHPDIVYSEVDQLPFLMRGHTVVFMAGYSRVEAPGYVGFFNIDGGEFTRGGSHSENDDFDSIEERRPGVIHTNMRAFSLFLEEMLMIQ